MTNYRYKNWAKIGIISGAIIALAAALPGCESKPNIPPGSVSINGSVWTVESAITASQRSRGLGGRESLALDAGMLFVFPNARKRNFCMRGCVIPIDAVFISPDRTVTAVHEMQVEHDVSGQKYYGSVLPAQWVLEVAAGTIKSANIKPGDKVFIADDISSPADAKP